MNDQTIRMALPSLEQVVQQMCKRSGVRKDTKNVKKYAPNNCFAMATALVAIMKRKDPGCWVKLRTVYGAWHGVDVERPERLTSRHGWAQYEDTVIDPTRWVFEGDEPYIWVGPIEADCDPDDADYYFYDEGARRMENQLVNRPVPPPPQKGEKTCRFKWGGVMDAHFAAVLHTDSARILSRGQLFYLANMDPNVLGREPTIMLYHELKKRRMLALIPIDTQHWVEHELHVARETQEVA